MSDADLERLQRLLGSPALAALRKRLRARLGGGDARTIELRGLAENEFFALAQLVGRPSRRRRSIVLDVGELDATLSAAGVAASLRDALEHLDGPIVDVASERAATAARWNAVVTACTEPTLAALVAGAAGPALLKRLARGNTATAGDLVAHAAEVLHQLPQRGMPRAQLAAQTLGDAHALDGGRPVAALVLAALRHRTGRVEKAEGVRSVWASQGILVNELARPVLFLNVPADEPVGAAGTPQYLSLRELVRRPPPWRVSGVDVYVCENPNIVAIAADALGSDCAPLVCTDGMLAAAQRTLLAQLAAAGACLHYHGDFDWPGIGIGNVVMRTFAATPWRYRAADYAAGLARLPRLTRSLGDGAVAAAWDETLMPTMVEHGATIPEEAVAETLIADLRRIVDA